MTQYIHEEDVISFTLDRDSKVSVEIYDLNGNKCGMVARKQFQAGHQQISADSAQLRIPPGKYVYYLQIENSGGLSRICRTITVS